MSDYILEITNFRVSIQDKKVLRSIDLNIPKQGVSVILGPSGTGKSTLLRTLAGLNTQNPMFNIAGHVLFMGQPLMEQRPPSLVAQKVTQMLHNVKESLLSNLPNRADLSFLEQVELLTSICQDLGQEWMVAQFNQQVIHLSSFEQRKLSIVREFLCQPDLLMLDEPTSNLKEDEIESIISLIQHIAKTTPVLMISHHLAQTKRMANFVALIANGCVQESNDVEAFFQNPQNPLTQQYLRTGSCAELSSDELDLHDQSDEPNNPLENHSDLAVEVVEIKAQKMPVIQPITIAAIEPEQQVTGEQEDALLQRHIHNAKSHYMGPNGFFWLIKGRMAGAPCPGVMGNTEKDLELLKNIGINHLVSLTENIFPLKEAEAFDLTVSHFPINDMSIPAVGSAYQFCLDMDRRLDAGDSVVIHCKAGLGRTGTMLAIYYLWIYQGSKTDLQAIQYIRSLNHLMIQSQEQVDFIKRFYQKVLVRVFKTPSEVG